MVIKYHYWSDFTTMGGHLKCCQKETLLPCHKLMFSKDLHVYIR